MLNRRPFRKASHTSNPKASKASKGKSAARRQRFLLDPLESRVMLTVVTGGDVFEYIDAAGKEVRVSANGNIQADLVAGVLDDQNQLILTDMPGHYFASSVGRAGTDTLGGLGGQDGVEPVTLNEAFGAPTFYGGLAAPSDSIHFRALASNPISGETYGINVYTTLNGTTPQNHVNIVQLNNQTGAGTLIADLTNNAVLQHNPNLAGSLPAGTQNTTVAATAAAIDQSGTLLYFVAVDNTPQFVPPPSGGGAPPAPPATFNTPRLYVYNLNSGTLSAVSGTFGVTSADNFVNISAMAFVPGTNQLVGFASRGGTATGGGGTGGGGGGTNATQDTNNDAPLGDAGSLVNIPLGNTDGMGNGVAVTLDGEDVGNITGLSFVQNDPTLNPGTFVLATQNDGEDSQLLRIRRSTGTAFIYGGLTDLQDTGDAPIRGQDIQDLTWNPTLTNPYTGEMGVLLATDASTDDLLFIDSRLRPTQADIYHINVTRADEAASIAISQVALYDPKSPATIRPDIPFDGNSPNLQVVDAQGGENLNISSGEGTGTVYIGARTRDITPNTDLEQDIPVISGSLTGTMGSTVPGAVETNGILRPGITVSTGQITDFVSPVPTIADRLLGSNLSGIQGVATGPPDFIAVIDSDQVDAGGNRIASDELALVNPTTGNAYYGGGVYDATTLKPLSHVSAMAYGDLNSDGVNELYAVYVINNIPTLGQLIDNQLSPEYGAFHPIAAIAGGSIPSIQAMTFTPDGTTLYMVDGQSNLRRVDPTNGNVLATLGVVRDVNSNEALSINSMGFSDAGTLYGQDLKYGRLVDINLSSGIAGAASATPAGSLSPTIGAISWSKTQHRFVGVDNVYGGTPLQVASGLNNGSSSALMYLTGTNAAASKPLNVGGLLVGGTVSGQVDTSGGVGTFYAGWLITGDTRGLAAGTPLLNDLATNFTIGGDLNNLVVRDSIGTLDMADVEPSYFTAFNVVVGGATGEIRTGDSYLGVGRFELQPDAPSSTTFQREVESNYVPPTGSEITAFQLGLLNDSFFSNNTFATAQVLAGTAGSPVGAYTIDMRGELNTNTGDTVDYFGIPAMAGQLITVQTIADLPAVGGIPTVQFGVFDPDGRLITSSYSSPSAAAFAAAPLQFRADRPGVYRIAVGAYGDMDFVDGTTSGPAVSPTGTGAESLTLAMGYYLSVSNLGALSLGGVTVANNIFNVANPLYYPSDFDGALGDIGAITAGGTYFAQSPSSIKVDAGNLRALVAGNIGDEDGNSPTLVVPNGSIGLLSSTVGMLQANPNPLTAVPVGYDYQIIDAAGTLTGNFIANRAMGIIRAADIDGGVYTVNADNIGNDGVIDLFDVSGGFNGPAITTGPGGNVRYIRAGSVVRDPLFGGGVGDEMTNNDPGVPVILNDDSGSRIVIQPGTAVIPADTTNTGNTGGTTTPTGPTIFQTSLTNILTYPIRGSGGVVLVSFTADGPIQINASGTGAAGSAEIGEIDMITPEGFGTPVVLDANGNPIFFVPPPPPPVTTQPNVGGDGSGTSPTPTPTPTPTSTEPTPTPVNIGITGSAKVDVLGVAVMQSEGGALNSLDNYNNSTGGELVSIIASTIGGLSSANVGVAINHTGAALNPKSDLATLKSAGGSGQGGSTQGGSFASVMNSYPFNQQHIGVQSGNIGIISASEAIGNVAVFGTIGTLQPNSDGRDNPAVFEGIAGPIVVNAGSDTSTGGSGTSTGGSGTSTGTTTPGALTPPVTDYALLPAPSGSLITANLGEGLYASGSGAVGYSGLYVSGRISTVNNGGTGSDIRGNIIAGQSIGSINLTNGSIINTMIAQGAGGAGQYDFARQGPTALTSENQGTTTTPAFEIGSIRLKGNGGIIGSSITAADVGPISVAGFGIISSSITSNTAAVISDISAGGYGIRNTFINGGSTIGRLTANGNGANLSTAGLEASVRQSELGLAFDPYSLRSLNSLNDIHGFLGTSAAAPVINGRTDTGVIEDVTVVGSRNFDGATAYQIRSTNPANTPTTFYVANSVGSIVTSSAINGLAVITGKLNAFRPASDVFNLKMTIAGPISNVNINGSLAGSSFINAIGSNGTIGTLNIANDLIGTIQATGRIQTINVGRNLSGNINILGGSRKGGGLGSLFFGGTLANGSLNINGDVGTITSGGSFGQLGDQLNINGSIQTLQVRGDLLANVHVSNTAKKIDIFGSILDGVTVSVDNTINALLVGGNTNAGALIEARVLKKLKVAGVNLATYRIG